MEVISSIFNSNKNDLRKIVRFGLKSVLIFLIFVAFSLIVENSLINAYTISVENEFPEFLSVHEALTNNVEVIFLGDSVVGWSAKDDRDKRNIGELLNNQVGEAKVKTITHAAYHMGIFEAFSNYICASPNKPKIVVLPINLRSFGSEWDPRPHWQFNEEIDKINGEVTRVGKKNTALSNLWFRFYNLFSEYEIVSMERQLEWEKQTVTYKREPIGKIKDIRKAVAKDESESGKKTRLFIYKYMYDLDPNHRKVISLKKTVDQLGECGVSPVVYITPVDYQEGEKYLGDDFTEVMNKNIAVLFEALGKNGHIMQDMSYDLDSSKFNYGIPPNEHLFIEGRVYVAKKLAERVISHLD